MEGLESVVLNSVISFHLGKSMNKYCMMVVNYLIILLWLFLAAGLLRRFCYIEGVMVIRCAVSSLESLEKIDVAVRKKKLCGTIVFWSKLCLIV